MQNYFSFQTPFNYELIMLPRLMSFSDFSKVEKGRSCQMLYLQS